MLKEILILAGGQGTRLKSISGDTPKPLVPVGKNHVFLDEILWWIEKFEIQRVLLSLCYRPHLFQNYLENRYFDFEVEFIVEPTPLGTGGAIKYAMLQAHLNEAFGVINGDTYLRFDWSEMVEAFENSKSSAMIGLSHVDNTERYGTVVFEQQRALGFKEKTSSSGPGWINNGCYLLSPEVFEGYPNEFSIETEVFPDLCRREQLSVFQTNSEFFDIGVPEDYYKFVHYLTQ